MIIITDNDINKATKEIPNKMYEFNEMLGYVANWFDGNCYNRTAIVLENNERIFFLNLINNEISKAEQINTTVKKLTMLYDLKNKLSKK